MWSVYTVCVFVCTVCGYTRLCVCVKRCGCGQELCEDVDVTLPTKTLQVQVITILPSTLLHKERKHPTEYTVCCTRWLVSLGFALKFQDLYTVEH